MAKVAINGFGRIGRLFFRQAFSAKGGSASGGGAEGIDIVAINDLGDLENLAYLVKYDTVYGRYDKSVEVKEGKLVVDGRAVDVVQEKDPAKLPWKDMGVHIVVESTGAFDEYKKAKAHIAAGAKRVVITAPAKDPDGTEGKTVLVGVNESDLESVVLTSNGSCTTNAASPVVAILAENPGIVKAMVNTAHGYTATQGLVDGPTHGHDFRRGRAAAVNIVPSSTGAAIAVARAVHELEGKFDGVALRVPVASGSIADITFLAKRKTTAREINTILKEAAESDRWSGILKVSDEPLVSSDIIGEPYGAIVDANFTRVVDGDLVKVLSWYDNEYGYVSTLVRHVASAASVL